MLTIQLALLLLLFSFLFLHVFRYYSHEPFATTIADITESRVKNEIEQILQYQQLFGFPIECEKGKTSGNDTPTKTLCTVPKVDASWLPSEPAVKECFSILIPILEATKCDVHGGIATSTQATESKNTNKSDTQIDALQKVKTPTTKHLKK
jgi:hypothetical protein